jgi:hypothetical protein
MRLFGALLLGASLFVASPASALRAGGIDELIPASGRLPGNASFLAVARRQLLATDQGSKLYAQVAAHADVQVRQDTIVSPRGGEKRVIGIVSRPTAEDAIVAGDAVLLKDFVIAFDEERFLTAARTAPRQLPGSRLPGALYAHELGHLRALIELGPSAFSYDGRTLHLKGDAQTRRRNLARVLFEACDEQRKVGEELVPESRGTRCSHAAELQQLAPRGR